MPTSTAESFDAQVPRFEILRTKDKFRQLRKNLLQNITGNVLEIAPGPGFNFIHYQHIDSLTTIDISPKMIASAKSYWESLSRSTSANFLVGDVTTAQFASGQFDAIVSTCSLCAYADPVTVLNNLAKWCKPDGRIYMLEHGLSNNPVVRIAQKAFDPIHYKIHSCHCDRDITKIVAASNLELVSAERPRQLAVIDFMYYINARPKTNDMEFFSGR